MSVPASTTSRKTSTVIMTSASKLEKTAPITNTNTSTPVQIDFNMSSKKCNLREPCPVQGLITRPIRVKRSMTAVIV
jgi:hypothetical protein